jgi:HTH-type transcriptional regulator, competence development regulator
MKMKITKEWLLKNADRDKDLEVTAGFLTVDKLNAVYGRNEEGQQEVKLEESRLAALAKLVNLRRRLTGLSLEALANEADVDLEDLICIEKEIPVQLSVRTIHKLSVVLKLPQAGLLRLTGAIAKRDDCFTQQALRFVARAQTESKPSKQEIEVLEEYVKFLTEERRL